MQAALAGAFAEPGPWLIVAKVDKTDRARIGEWPPLPVDVFEKPPGFPPGSTRADGVRPCWLDLLAWESSSCSCCCRGRAPRRRARPTPPWPAGRPAAAAATSAASPEWDRSVAAAQQEGEVIVWSAVGATVRQHEKEAFEKAYPGIKVTLSNT